MNVICLKQTIFKNSIKQIYTCLNFPFQYHLDSDKHIRQVITTRVYIIDKTIPGHDHHYNYVFEF